MKKLLSLAAVCVLIGGLTSGGVAAPPDTVITVDAGKPGVQISPNMWGIFFEEINFGGDGGLYAELVRHRNFEGREPLEGWSLMFAGAKGEMQVDPDVRMNDVRKQSLRVEVDAAGDDGSANLVNDGYWGIPVQEGEKYSFSMFVKGDAKSTGQPISVSLRDEALDKVYATADLGRVTGEWQKLECTLTPDGTDNDGRLVVSMDTAGTYWLDMVSLFPPTYKSQPNGLRPDLMQLLMDLRPSFLRFPGGCFAEGHTLDDAFRFKETLGLIEDRKGRPGFWNYYSTDGLGYYEYLRLAEDLGADPIFCINPGGNNGGRQLVPMDEMGPWLQTAVDAIEFAIGPATSEWGAKRAAMGHPEPFACQTFYLQIGNETEFGNRRYLERFKAYHDKVKSTYPDDNVRVIADSWGAGGQRSVDTYAVDFHEYMSWGQAVRDRDVHDNAQRGEPYIFEGEYATRSGSGILQALSEAVFMMGLEENGDEVKMACYAPLFGNVNGCQWRPDLIYFDNHRAMGTISYYVQQLYSLYRGDRVLPIEVKQPLAEAARQGEKLAGSVGFATWNTEAEFKDLSVVVDGKTVYQNKLNTKADIAGWETGGNGQWSVQDGALRQTAQKEDCRIWLPGKKWSKYEVHVKARKIAGAEAFMVMVQVDNAENFAWVNFGGWGNTQHGVERAQGGGKTHGRNVPGSLDADHWYDVVVKVDGMKVSGSLDGKQVIAVDMATMNELPKYDLYASAVTDVATGGVLLRVVNFAEAPRRAKLAIRGGGKLSGTGTAITLATEDQRASQSLDDPQRYVPKTSKLDDVSRQFEYEFPPCSFTLLRLDQSAE